MAAILEAKGFLPLGVSNDQFEVFFIIFAFAFELIAIFIAPYY